MTAPEMSLLVDRVRAELVGRGAVPSPLHDATGDDAVRICHARHAADVYIVARLSLVLTQLERPGTGGDLIRDARLALGEHETFLGLREAAA